MQISILRWVAEVVAFALGGFSSMPAVRNFSICAALAVLLDFLLQAWLDCHGLQADFHTKNSVSCLRHIRSTFKDHATSPQL